MAMDVCPAENCGICGDPHETHSCKKFVTLEVIDDTFSLSRARLTLPKGLSVADRVDGSTTVIAKTKFDVGIRFGPFIARTSTTLSPKISFPLKLFDLSDTWDINSESLSHSTDVFLETDDENTCNWMCLVSSAETVHEQNLICFQMRKELYFLVIKNINVGEELKVWYSPHYAKKMYSAALIQSLLPPDTQEINGCLSPGIIDCNGGPDFASSYAVPHDNVVCLSDANNENNPKKIMDVNSASTNMKSNLWNINGNNSNKICIDASKVHKKRPSSKKSHKLSILPNIQPSYVLCFDTANNSWAICETLGNNNNSSSNSNLEGSFFSPLLLGARQLKNKWECNICKHIEYNVSSYAKHLMTHYKNDEKCDKNSFVPSVFLKTCACGVVLKTRKKLKEHIKVCSKLQIDDEDLSKVNNRPNPAVKSDANCIDENLRLPSTSPPRENIVTSCTGNNVCNIFDNACEGVDPVLFNGNSQQDLKQQEQQLLSKPGNNVMDTNVNIKIDFNLSNPLCEKDTDFHCFSFPDSLKSVVEEQNDKQQECIVGYKNTTNKLSLNDIHTTMEETDKTGFDVNKTIAVGNGIQKDVEEPDSLLNSVGNIPPILDLTDDEIIVFQSIKHFSKVNSNNFSGNIFDKEVVKDTKVCDVKTPLTSLVDDNLKQSCQIHVTNANEDNHVSDYTIDFQGIPLMQDTFGFEKSIDFNDTVNSKCVDRDSSCSLLDKNDQFNNFLQVTSNDIVNTSGKDNIYKSEDLNTDLQEKINVLVSEQLQSQTTVPFCDENNIFNANNEVSGTFEEQENTSNKVPVKKFECDICEKKFHKSLYLYRHLRRHTGEFSCALCMAVFARKENLVSHICSSEKVLQSLKKNGRLCHLCGKVFKSKSEFKIHQSSEDCASTSALLSGNDAEKFICVFCGENCNDITQLITHTEVCCSDLKDSDTVSKQRQLLCDKCGTLFKSKRSLNLHIASTHGNRPFCCPVCQKRFNRNDVLKNHMISHQPVLPCHDCPICDKKFKTKKSLCAHIKMHSTSSKRFKCDQCGVAFFQKVGLIHHLKTHSNKEQQFLLKPVVPELVVNNLAGFITAASDYDAVGASSIAPDLNRDVIADKTLATIDAHDLNKTFKCGICSRNFSKEQLLKTHLKKVHKESGNFVCTICSTILKHKTSLKRHILRRHPMEKHLAARDNNSSVLPSCDNKVSDKIKIFIPSNPLDG